MIAPQPQAPSQRPLKLLMVTPRFFPDTGGVESHVYQVGKRLVMAGVDLTVLTTDRTGTRPVIEWIDGIRVRRVRAYPARQDFYFAPALWKAIRSEPWDLAHIQSYHTLVAPLAMLACRKAGIPYVVTFHGGGHSSILRSRARTVQQWLLRGLLRGAERLVAIARFEIDIYASRLRIPRERFVLIPNGVDLATPADETPTGEEQPAPLLIASVGRLERYKGHQRILEALPEILKTHPDARLWIAGEGPYEEELRRRAEQLHVASQVDIFAIPGSERERMARELRRAGVVVLLSEFETHPIAVLEAYSLGRPVLVANNSGMQELSEMGLARSIALDSSPVQVAKAVLDLYQCPPPKVERQLPTWDDCAGGLYALYMELVKR